jgi:hypothetical protein
VDSNLTPVERRRAPRIQDAATHGIVHVRVRPGHEAVLVNVSPDGAAIETPCRLLPGSGVELQLESMHGRTTVRGRVSRCAVIALDASRVTYGAVVCFESRLARLPCASPEYPVPIGAAPQGTSYP